MKRSEKQLPTKASFSLFFNLIDLVKTVWKALELQKLSKKNKFQRVRDKLEAKKRFQETIICKLCETNSSFHVKLCTMGKFWFLFFKRSLLVLKKVSFR